MSRTICHEMGDGETTRDLVPAELVELKERVESQPPRVRAELAPLVEEALEHARFRASVVLIARDALERFRLDLSMLKFDLEATRREREALKEQLQD
jgi:hypothetical protein